MIAEKIAFDKLKIQRIEIISNPKNKASRRVAEKSSYQKQGILKKHTIGKKGKLEDSVIYAKCREQK